MPAGPTRPLLYVHAHSVRRMWGRGRSWGSGTRRLPPRGAIRTFTSPLQRARRPGRRRPLHVKLNTGPPAAVRRVCSLQVYPIRGAPSTPPRPDRCRHAVPQGCGGGDDIPPHARLLRTSGRSASKSRIASQVGRRHGTGPRQCRVRSASNATNRSVGRAQCGGEQSPGCKRGRRGHPGQKRGERRLDRDGRWIP